MSKPKKSRSISERDIDEVPRFNFNASGNPYTKRFATAIDTGGLLTVKKKVRRTVEAPSVVTRHSFKTKLGYRPFVSGVFTSEGVTQQINGTTSTTESSRKVWIDDIKVGEVIVGTFGFGLVDVDITLFLHHNGID
jgi:hypothetical protein